MMLSRTSSNIGFHLAISGYPVPTNSLIQYLKVVFSKCDGETLIEFGFGALCTPNALLAAQRLSELFRMHLVTSWEPLPRYLRRLPSRRFECNLDSGLNHCLGFGFV